MDTFNLGFIIIRHVNNSLTNNYWIKCYDCIRKFYPENTIVIIDDNSNYNFITKKELYNTIIIQSEFPGRGELLPYYYYVKHKWFNNAFILHDSVFIQTHIKVDIKKYNILWSFDSKINDVYNETETILKLFNNPELIAFYHDTDKWVGCFGGMSIISHEFLTHINNKYNLDILIPVITNRTYRCCFERIIACLMQIEYKPTVLMCNIYDYCQWGIELQNTDKYQDLPLLKVWTGR